MKKILLISYFFHPDSGAVTTCIKNILTVLGKKIDIVVYTPTIRPKQSKREELFGITVKRLNNFWNLVRVYKNSIINKIQISDKSHFVKRYLILLIRAVFLPVQIIGNYYGLLSEYAWNKRCYNGIIKNEDMTSYHAIIAVAYPFSDIRIAHKLKKKYPKLKEILIEFDPYTYNPVFLTDDKIKKDKFNLRYNEENEWFKYADNIIILQETYDLLRQTELFKWKDKLIPAAIPNLIFPDNKAEKLNRDNSEIHIVYAGIFYKDIRNPKFTFELFNKICKKNRNVKLHIIGNGCEQHIDTAKSEMKENLIFYGKREKQFTMDIVSSADILLNISNSIVSQLPSKIIEYLGMCKPIINIYSIDDDICKKVLQKYPLSFSVREDFSKVDVLSDEVLEFVTSNFKNKCDAETIKQNYYEYLPEAFTEKIITCLNTD